jgi:hypothetical protein
VSKSSWKVGAVAIDDVIRAADEAWCTPNSNGRATWTTADLGDFVQGVLERALYHLEQLKPEVVRSCGDDGVRCPEHSHDHDSADVRLVDLFSNHTDD